MKIFSLMYQHAMRWARLPKALWYLATLSFAESSFFPIPPDVMLAPMSLAQPARAWRFALITTVASVPVSYTHLTYLAAHERDCTFSG